MQWREGEVLAETYRLLRLVGEGPHGTVVVAEQIGLSRRVAIKLLSGDDDGRRLERVARTTALVKSKSVVEVLEARIDHEPPFVVSALARGRSLAALLAAGVAPARAVRIAAAVLAVLEGAHASGVVHANLKPSNIFVENDHDVQLGDFGFDAEEPDQTRTAVLSLATAGYRAPEQLRGEAIDARVDIFAMGVILFELLEGVRPFHAPKGVDEVAKILAAPAPPSRSSVGRVIQKALGKSPGSRFRGAAEMRRALLRRPRRSELVASVFGTVLVAVFGIITWLARAPVSHRADRPWPLAPVLIATPTDIPSIVPSAPERPRVHRGRGHAADAPGFISADPPAPPAPLRRIAWSHALIFSDADWAKIMQLESQYDACEPLVEVVTAPSYVQYEVMYESGATVPNVFAFDSTHPAALRCVQSAAAKGVISSVGTQRVYYVNYAGHAPHD